MGSDSRNRKSATTIRQEELVVAEIGSAIKRARGESHRVLTLQCGTLALILFLWWAASGTLVDRFFLSDPMSVATAFVEIVRDGSLWWHLQRTLVEMSLGYLVGGITGIVAAIVVSSVPLGEPIARPIVLSVWSIPKTALAPLIVIWFGIDLLPKVVIASLLVFFVVYFNTLAGIATAAPGLIASVRVMGASRAALFAKVIVPIAAPFIFAALRIAVPGALIGAIIGELVSSSRGIGYLIAVASSRYETATVLAGIFSLMVFGLLLNGAVAAAERRVFKWRPAGEVRMR